MRTRTRLAVGTTVLAAVVGAVVVVTVRAPSGPSAPLPADDAAPRTVATAFLDAAVRRDCGSLRALSTPDDTLWCPSSLWERWHDDDPRMQSWHALRATDGDDAERCYMYELQESGVLGMTPGDATWGLCLHRDGATWRVTEEGVG